MGEPDAKAHFQGSFKIAISDIQRLNIDVTEDVLTEAFTKLSIESRAVPDGSGIGDSLICYVPYFSQLDNTDYLVFWIIW